MRSRHLLVRLLMAKVPALTLAPTYLGRLRLQAKKGAPGGSASIHKNFYFKLSKN